MRVLPRILNNSLRINTGTGNNIVRISKDLPIREMILAVDKSESSLIRKVSFLAALCSAHTQIKSTKLPTY